MGLIHIPDEYFGQHLTLMSSVLSKCGAGMFSGVIGLAQQDVEVFAGPKKGYVFVNAVRGVDRQTCTRIVGGLNVVISMFSTEVHDGSLQCTGPNNLIVCLDQCDATVRLMNRAISAFQRGELDTCDRTTATTSVTSTATSTATTTATTTQTHGKFSCVADTQTFGGPQYLAIFDSVGVCAQQSNILAELLNACEINTVGRNRSDSPVPVTMPCTPLGNGTFVFQDRLRRCRKTARDMNSMLDTFYPESPGQVSCGFDGVYEILGDCKSTAEKVNKALSAFVDGAFRQCQSTTTATTTRFDLSDDDDWGDDGHGDDGNPVHSNHSTTRLQRNLGVRLASHNF